MLSQSWQLQTKKRQKYCPFSTHNICKYSRWDLHQKGKQSTNSHNARNLLEIEVLGEKEYPGCAREKQHANERKRDRDLKISFHL